MVPWDMTMLVIVTMMHTEFGWGSGARPRRPGSVFVAGVGARSEGVACSLGCAHVLEVGQDEIHVLCMVFRL